MRWKTEPDLKLGLLYEERERLELVGYEALVQRRAVIKAIQSSLGTAMSIDFRVHRDAFPLVRESHDELAKRTAAALDVLELAMAANAEVVARTRALEAENDGDGGAQ